VVDMGLPVNCYMANILKKRQKIRTKKALINNAIIDNNEKFY